MVEAKKIHFKESSVQIELNHPSDLQRVAEILKLPVIIRGKTNYIFQSDKIMYFCKSK